MLEFPLINDISRKIIHIDMDAFFAQKNWGTWCGINL